MMEGRVQKVESIKESLKDRDVVLIHDKMCWTVPC